MLEDALGEQMGYLYLSMAILFNVKEQDFKITTTWVIVSRTVCEPIIAQMSGD